MTIEVVKLNTLYVIQNKIRIYSLYYLKIIVNKLSTISYRINTVNGLYELLKNYYLLQLLLYNVFTIMFKIIIIYYNVFTLSLYVILLVDRESLLSS